MRRSNQMRCVLTGSVAAAVLTACGGPQPPIGAYGASGAMSVASHRKTFRYTGGKQSFNVPAGVTQVTITARGAVGAVACGSSYIPCAYGGDGGGVIATIPVSPGERLAIFVGGSGLHGGFNGGGTGADYLDYGYGGGASDVRQGGDQLADRVLVAGGGGGAGADGYVNYGTSYYGPLGGNGGNGGGRKGASGDGGQGDLSGYGAGGGTQRTGGKSGAGYSGSCDGGRGQLGAGGDGGSGCHISVGGGGGGGGYYGGGGGGGGGYDNYNGGRYGSGGGGGGGSSFAEKSATHVKMTHGSKNGNDGSILITW